MCTPRQASPSDVKYSPQIFADTLVESLARGHEVVFRPQGRSMLPWLREGEKVRLLPAAARRIRRGDIALYRRENGQVILHRVVHVGRSAETRSPRYGCLGDAEGGLPETVPASAVVGVVDLSVSRRWVFLATEPCRRLLNRILSKMGIHVRHG